MAIELPRADPAPLSALSPTAANDLLACPYRLAWRLDPRYRTLRRPSPWSSLGVVAHAVAEDVAKGLLVGADSTDDARERIESSWVKHEASANKQLHRRWAPASPPPSSEWPGYHLVRARTVRKGLRTFGAGGVKTHASKSTIVEADLAAPDAGLSGRPDRVEGRTGERCVVDLKTGLAQQGATESQRRQLLIYCHLVASATGDMPTRIAIEDPSGKRWEETVTANEVEDAVSTVQDARRRYEGTPVAQLATLAAPGADTCRHCAYRLVCNPYWRSLETSWEHGSVAGTVSEIRASGQGLTAVMHTESPIDAAGPDWLVTSVPVATDLGVGSATVIDAELTGASRHLRWRWSTLSWPAALGGEPA